MSPYDALNAQLIQLGRLHSPLPFPRIEVPDRVDGDQAGGKIEDAHGQADLDALADALLTEVQRVTSDESSIMILSLSGGKKGMSHIAGQVMSLCGRPHDQLVHIAATPAGIERCENFFFPSSDRYGEERYTWRKDDGTEDGCSVSEVSLELAQQSYLPLRSLVEQSLSSELFAKFNFNEIVTHYRKRFDPTAPQKLTMKLNVKERTIEVFGAEEGKLIRISSAQMEPKPFAYLWCLAVAQPRGACLTSPMSDLEAVDFLTKYEKLLDSKGDPAKKRFERTGLLFSIKTAEELKKSSETLSCLDLHHIKAVFSPLRYSEQLISEVRKKTQREMLVECRKCVRKLLEPWLSLKTEDYTPPKGRNGPNGGLPEHRLPDTWHIEILEE